MQFPILDGSCSLLAWTASPPRFQGNQLRHSEAETLIGLPLVMMPVRFMSGEHVERCGGSVAEGGWCLALSPPRCITKMPIVVAA